VSTPAITATAVERSFGQTKAVAGLTFTAQQGAVTALLGPNGAGKSTTLRLAEGFLRPDAGTIRVLGLDPMADARALRPRVGVMLQSGGLPAAVRAAEAVRYTARLYANPLSPDALIDTLGLANLGRTPFRRLSGGEQRRVALAIALIGRPELVILDEPTAGMDPQGRRLVWDIIGQLRDQGVSVLLSTHLMDEAADLADHVVIVDHGAVIAQGSPSELTADGVERLSFSAPAHLPVADLRAALPKELTVVEAPAGKYTVSGALDPQVLAAVTAWCAGHGAMTHDLTVSRRSLEDVFLELTGRELRA
jgi:ABC-2 type transport system ATP-binding protein